MAQEYCTILIVEDESDHRELILRSFESLEISHLVRVVADGEAAMDYLHQRGEFSNPEQNPGPQLIILDLRLTKMDGLEVLRAIKTNAEWKKIPVVIYSGSTLQQDIDEAYRLKANSYLVKPSDAEENAKVLREMARYWLQWNQLPPS
ncbi:MAG: response regulator [Gammaproteobacteria bacterium]|nr:response regulator [Gammaproteobacteria bacterium]